MGSSRCLAVVDDAHSAALAVATNAVKEGYKIRQDYVKGTTKAGSPRMVKQQLFKGNEVWFWLGTGADEAKIEIEVYDATGAKVGLERVARKDAVAIKVSPPKTGTYRIVFKISGKEETFDWALVYGWK